jgi:hypothetical protein
MGAIHDPFEALAQRVGEIPGPVDYLTRPRPVINPETGYQLQQIMPNGQFGPGRTAFTPGQRIAQGTAYVGVPAAAGFALAPSQAPAPNRPQTNIVDEGHLDPNLFGVQYPKAGMDRTNTLGVDELSAYPAGAVRRGMDRSDAPGVDELSAYPHGAVRLARQVAAPVKERAPIDFTSGQSAAGPSVLSRIFSGGDYQSNNELVGKPMGGAPVNWGSPDSAADFFRADRELRKQRPEMFERQAEARGGAPKVAANTGGKDAALHKALEIIHHLLTRGR